MTILMTDATKRKIKELEKYQRRLDALDAKILETTRYTVIWDLGGGEYELRVIGASTQYAIGRGSLERCRRTAAKVDKDPKYFQPMGLDLRRG